MNEQKKALIVVENNFVPLDPRIRQEAASLRSAGWAVTVICPAPTSDFTVPPAGPDGAVHLDGIRVFYFALSAASKGVGSYLKEYLTAFLRISSLCRKLWRSERFDVLQVCNPPDIFFPLMLFYRALGAAVIYDHHDLFPEFVRHRFGGVAGRILSGAAAAMEYFTYHCAHVTITVNESYRDVAIQRGHLPSTRLCVVRNGPNSKAFSPLPPAETLKKGFPFLACYIGIMGYEDGVPEMIEAIRHLVKDRGRSDILFHLMGGGALHSWALGTIKELGLDRYVEMPGMVTDRSVIRQYLSAADVCLSPEPLSPLNAKSTFIKVGEYVAMGKPVVAFDLKETRFTAREAAVYVPNGDTDAFGQAIADLMDAPEQRAAMGECGRERFLSWLSWEHQEKQLFEAYERAQLATKKKWEGAACPEQLDQRGR